MGEARARARAGLPTRWESLQQPSKPAWLTLAERIFAVDLRSLGLLRIILASLILIDLVGRSMDLTAHYTDIGILPRAALLARDPNNWGPHLSVHMMTGKPLGEAAWFVVAGLWAIALLIGYRTPISAVVTWFLLSSLHARNPFILNSADDLTRFLLFWCLFLPIGARFSLDERTGHGPRLPAGTDNRFLSVGTAALLLQIAFMYWFAVAAKTDESWRISGMAVYYTLSIDLYATPFGQFFLNFPQLLYYATFGTLWLEGLGPTLAFSPVATSFLRTIIAIAFFLFHLVFLNLCLDLGTFHYVAATCWIAFLPTPLWDWLYRKLGIACAAGGNVPLHPVMAPPSLLPAAKEMAEPTWSSGTLAPAAQAIPLRGAKAWRIAGNVVPGVLIVYVFLWLIRNVSPVIGTRLLPHSLDRIAQVTHLDQGWAMFAPKPFTDNGWYVFPATLKDGTQFDLMRGEESIGQPVTFEKPKILISHTFKNERWRRYIMNLWATQYSDQRPNYARYLCQEWNRTHTGNRQLLSLELDYMLQETLDNYEQAPVQRVVLLKWNCDESRGVTEKRAGTLDSSGRANATETHAPH